MDGACHSRKDAGCRGLFRNSQDTWKSAFSNYVGKCSNLCVELWGVLKGLDIAWEKGYRILVVQVDNKSVAGEI